MFGAGQTAAEEATDSRAPAEGEPLRPAEALGLERGESRRRRVGMGGRTSMDWVLRRAWRSAPCGPKPPPRRGRGGGGRPRHPLRLSRPGRPASGTHLPRAPDSPMPSAAATGAQFVLRRRRAKPSAPHSAFDRGRPFRWTRSSRAENPPRPSLLDVASTPSAGPNTLRAAPKARTTPNTPPSPADVRPTSEQAFPPLPPQALPPAAPSRTRKPPPPPPGFAGLPPPPPPPASEHRWAPRAAAPALLSGRVKSRDDRRPL